MRELQQDMISGVGISAEERRGSNAEFGVEKHQGGAGAYIKNAIRNII